jgi:tRNA A37 N6-isopentenylltransferase MiaA
VEVGGASRVTPTPSTSRSDHRLHHNHHICFGCFHCRVLEERVQKRQSLLRMRSLLLATRSNYCAGFRKGRLPSIMKHSPPSLSSAARPAAASSSSALFAAPSSTITAPENEDGTMNGSNEGSMYHLLRNKNQQFTQLQPTQQHYRPLVIVIAGPTAVGKSDVASLICSTNIARDIMQSHFANYNHCHSIPSSESSDSSTVIGGNSSTTSSSSSTTMIRGHVISADSVQVYRGNIDIGSNKPSAEELMKTPYHLVGIVDPPNTTTTASTTATTSSMTTTTLDATMVANTTISLSPIPPSTSAYGAADWMRDVMYVLRSLPTMANSNHNPAIAKIDDEDNRPEYNHENNDDMATYDNEALIKRREYIDRDLQQNLGASSVTTTIDNDKASIATTSSSRAPTTPLSALSSPMVILPVVTGGTMMYLQWLVHGRPDAVRPTEEAAKRAAETINNFRRRRSTAGRRNDDDNNIVVLHSNHGITEAKQADLDEDEDEDATRDASCWEEASNYVSSLGPVFAKRVEKLPGRDWYRLRRLLEVAYTMSSKKKRKSNNNDVDAEDKLYSEDEILQQFTEKEIYTGIRSGSLADSGYDVRCFFLCPTDRMTHFHAVDLRCEQMLLRGLLRECADLYITGVLRTESQVSRAIGYRQTLEYLTRKRARENDGPALLKFIDDFATATRQYAKKQMQWFRREKDFAFIPVNMDAEKDERVARTAQLIADMCKLHPVEFDSELSSERKNRYGSGDTPEERKGTELQQQTPSLSTQTRLENERQGKGMKYFHSKRVHLVDGSDEFIKVMAEADACTRLVQSA